ncbi:MAG: protein kinase [Planctomycetes bacterium]|nr:protein kinase [Planctomycetota bacterium]
MSEGEAEPTAAPHPSEPGAGGRPAGPSPSVRVDTLAGAGTANEPLPPSAPTILGLPEAEPGGSPGVGSTITSDGGTVTRLAPSTALPAALGAPPPRVARYQVLAELGRGGMGVVYRVLHPDLGREMALKRILGLDPERVQRFQREAEVTTSLNHPGIVRVYDVGSDGSDPYLLMDLLPGPGLDRWLRQSHAPREIAAMGARVARALGFAHAQGVVHRDVKPSNVLLDAQGNPVLTDFGLARRFGEEAGHLTRSGAILGTPAYMAPEQASGHVRELGPASDVYALGAVLFEAFAGTPPFEPAEPLVLLGRIAKGPVPSIARKRPDLHRDLSTIVTKALAHEPGDRYRDANALADDLERFLEGRPILARPLPAVVRLARRTRAHPVPSALLLAAAAGVATGGALLFSARRAGRAESLARRGLACAREGRPIDAIAALREAVALNPADAAAGLELARLEAGAGERTRALETLDRLLDRAEAGAGAGPETPVAALALRARLRLDAGDAEAALADLELAARGRPEELEIEEVRGRALSAAGRTTEALACEERVSALRARLSRAALAGLPEDGQERAAALAGLVEKFPRAFELYEETARLRNKAGDRRGAQEAFRLAAGRLPDDPRPYQALARLAEDEGRLREAVEELAGAIRAANDAASFEARGRLYLRLGEFAAAQEDLTEAVRLEPTQDRQLLLARSIRHPDRQSALFGLRLYAIRSLSPYWLELGWPEMTGDEEAAGRALAELAAARPDDPEVRLALADHFAQARAWDAALHEYRGVATGPCSPRAHVGLGFCALAKKERDSARQEFDEALRLDPGAVEAAVGLFLVERNTDLSGDGLDRQIDPEGRLFSGSSEALRRLGRALLAGVAGPEEALRRLTEPMPACGPRTRLLLEGLAHPDAAAREAAAKALVDAGPEALPLLAGKADRLSRDAAARLRARHLRPDMEALLSVLLRRWLEGDARSAAALVGDHPRLAQALVGLIEDRDRPPWLRGLAVASAAAAARRSGEVRRAVLEAHEADLLPLYVHAALALGGLEGEDAARSLARGLGRRNNLYRMIAAAVFREQADRLPVPEVIGALAKTYEAAEERFGFFLRAGRSGAALREKMGRAERDLLVPPPGYEEVYALDALAQAQGAEPFRRRLAAPGLSETEAWLLAGYLERWPAAELLPIARALAQRPNEWVAVEGAGLLVACGAAEEAAPVLVKLAAAPVAWPGKLGRTISSVYALTPSLLLERVQSARPGAPRLRAIELLGETATRESVTVLARSAAPEAERTGRPGALGALCRLALRPETRPWVEEAFFSSLLRLYEGEPEKREAVNLALLAGLVGRRGDAGLTRWLRRASEGKDVFAARNALWALGVAGDADAARRHEEQTEAWLRDMAGRGADPGMLATFWAQAGRELDAAERLVVESMRKDEGTGRPRAGPRVALAEVRLAKGDFEGAKQALTELLALRIPDAAPFARFLRWLEAGRPGELHPGLRWRAANVDPPFAQTTSTFVVR